MLAKTMRLNMLYDFYYPLLTERQREYTKLYYYEDYSLTEIAEKTNVSRQAVYDTIKRTEQLLESYESMLRLYSKFTERNELLTELENRLISNEEDEDIKALIEKIRNTS